MPLDEAEYATEWCISLAQEIVDAQRALTAGTSFQSRWELNAHRFVERLENLEAGLTSNGMPREKRERGH